MEIAAVIVWKGLLPLLVYAAGAHFGYRMGQRRERKERKERDT